MTSSISDQLCRVAAVGLVAGGVLLCKRHKHSDVPLEMSECIDLVSGKPDSELLHRVHRMIVAATQQALPACRGATVPLQYGDITFSPDDATHQYRTELSSFISPVYGYQVDPSLLFPTAGVSQAVDILCTMVTRSGEVVLMEDPSFHCIPKIFQDRGLIVWPVQSDQFGMTPESFESQLLQAQQQNLKVSMCYFIPVFNNPRGHTMSVERRARLLELAAQYKVLMVADEVYQLLNLGSAPPPPICSTGHEWAVSVSSFSKILAPGLRVGWIEASPWLIAKLHQCGLQDSGGTISQFASVVVANAMQMGSLQTNMEMLIECFRARRDALVRALKNHLPEGCQFSIPGGGYFLWVELPAGTKAEDVMSHHTQKYGQARVLAKVGSSLSSGGNYLDCFRLCFARCTVLELEEAGKRLGGAIRDYLES